jgi:two-component system sensor histidine kinase TctE
MAALTRFEGDRTARKAGLGLAIVARLVEADHGKVNLEETAGGGLTAVIHLPAAAEHGATSAAYLRR